MQLRATNRSAAVTGLYAGLLGVAFGPAVDDGGFLTLAIFSLAFAIPSFVFVLGVRRDEMVGMWILRPDILRRIGLFAVSLICVSTLAQIAFLTSSGV
jgi:hypothetical protein